MIRGVLGSRASIGGVLGSGRGGAAAWWLAGGVSAANCVAAYQPIGAASLAASYTNLANPGTYDAAPGVAPTFDTATGWTFAAGQSLIFGSPITGTGARSVIVRYTSPSTTIANIMTLNVSAANDASDFTITPEIALRISGGNRIWGSGTANNVVVAVTGPAGGSTSDLIAYRDGSAMTPASTAAAAYNTGSAGGGFNRQSYSTGSSTFNGVISAAAIYNVTLSAAQVAAVSAAMSLL